MLNRARCIVRVWLTFCALGTLAGASGLDWTIVRPGGLKADPPAGSLLTSGENTLNIGEISRDLVAEVCVKALSDAKSANAVLEIVEQEKPKDQPQHKAGKSYSNSFNEQLGLVQREAGVQRQSWDTY